MSVVTTTILSQGKAIDPSYELLSMDIRREVDRLPSAQLAFLDGDAAQQTFSISDTDIFEPGREVEIKLRYEGESTGDTTVFKGRVVGHAVEASPRCSLLRVELKDAAVRLTRPRKSKVHREVTDDQAIARIVQQSGLRKKQTTATQPKHPEIVQYDCSDWDFILSRAEANGLHVVVEDGQLSWRKLAMSGAVRHTFEYGNDIYDFEIEADAREQFGALTGTAWDLKSLAALKSTAAKEFSLAQGSLKGAKLAQALGFGAATLSHPVPLDSKELQAWTDARLARSRISLLRGRLAVAGLPAIKLLDLIEIKGIGKKFNGKTLVTGLRHRVDQNGWRTDVQFGLSPRRFAERDGIREVSAAGLLPPASGLQIGVVQKIAEDPAKQHRVQIQLGGMDKADGQIWARWTSPDAAKDRGWYFLPEVGDEIVVGFLNDDPRQPVILGALFSSKNPPPAPFKNSDAKNINKGFVTKKGTKLSFVDADKPSLALETAGGNKLVLDDDTESIKLTDKHGNSVTMDKNGIQVKSSKDLKFEATGKVTIKGATADLEATGNLTLKGAASELQASGNLTLKGAKVDVQ